MSQPMEIKALILRGGESKRMGKDKALLSFHEQPQQEHLLRIFQQLQLPCCFSIQAHQIKQIPKGSAYILDQWAGIGPMGGIASALRQKPLHPWVVVACDMPLIGNKHILDLLDQRDAGKEGSFFFNSSQAFVEPLLGIWEPSAWPKVSRAIERGDYSMRRLLREMDINVIQQADPHIFLNINHPEELQQWQKKHKKNRPKG